MAFVPCEWYYENKLGDSCNNDCDNCFGNKDIRICIEDFDVVGEKLNIVTIQKGAWFECKFENSDHVLLIGTDEHDLLLKKYLYDKYFKHFIYNE